MFGEPIVSCTQFNTLKAAAAAAGNMRGTAYTESGKQLNKRGKSKSAKKRKRKPKNKSFYSRFLNAMHSRSTAIVFTKYSNMITFGIMTAILVAMTCVVHYDLLGLFPADPFWWYGGGGARTAEHHHHHEPVVMFDRDWLPRPGTDPATFRPQLTILVDDYDRKDVYDYDDSDWSDTPRARVDDDARWSAVQVEEDDNDAAADDASTDEAGDPDEPLQPPASCPLGGGPSSTGDATATKTCSVNSLDVDLATADAERPPGWPDSGTDDDDGYAAPGQERDDALF